MAPTHYYFYIILFPSSLSNNNKLTPLTLFSFNFIHNFPSMSPHLRTKKLFLLESDEFYYYYFSNADHVSSFSKHNYDCYWHSLSSNSLFFHLPPLVTFFLWMTYFILLHSMIEKNKSFTFFGNVLVLNFKEALRNFKILCFKNFFRKC